MKKFKKITALVMALFLLMSFAEIQSFAVTSIEDYQKYYETLDNTLVMLTPGKDATELNFAWHSEWSLKAPKVRLSKNADMADYVEFVGSTTFSENADQRVNNVTVTGLEENTTYYYTYGVNGDFSEPVKYQTHSFDSVKFVYVSDVQPHHKNDLLKESYLWNQSLESAFARNDDISFIVNGGDITHNGDYNEEWTAFMSPEYLRSYPMAAANGNHDKSGTTFTKYFNNPNAYTGIYPMSFGESYWFRYGDVLFVMINSIRWEAIGNLDTINAVKAAVEANPDAKWRVAVTHYDFYGPGPHVPETKVTEKKKMLVPIFEHYDFDLVLNGHDHVYGRSYFMEDDKIVENEGYSTGTVVDPEGILYVTASGSKGNSRTEGSYNYPWIAKDYISPNNCYSTIEITDDGQLKLVTVDAVTEKVIDTFNIVKTDFEPEYEENTFGLYGTLLKEYTGEYFIIFEMLYDLSTAVKRLFDRIIAA